GAVFALGAPLALPSLNNGQSNLILIGLVLHGAAAAARSRDRTAGLLLAAAAAVKVYPLAVGLLVSLARRRVLLWLVLGCAGFAALPFLLAPADYVAHQYRRFAEAARADDRHRTGHQVPPRDLYWVLRVYFVAPSE